MKRKIKHLQDTVNKVRKKGYILEAVASLNPRKYGALSALGFRHGIRYIAVILLLLFIAMSIISLPKVSRFPGEIRAELDKFEQFDIDVQQSMTGPALFLGKDPQVVIDTTGQVSEMTSEKLLITNEFLSYRPYGRVRQINVTELKMLTNNKDQISNLLTWVLILIIPSVLLASYVLFFIKYIVLILIMTLIVFTVNRMMKKDKGLRKSFMVSLYASTIMMLIEILFLPFDSSILLPFLQIWGMNFYGVTLLLYLALALLGSFYAKKTTGKRDYVEVEKVEWDF